VKPGDLVTIKSGWVAILRNCVARPQVNLVERPVTGELKRSQTAIVLDTTPGNEMVLPEAKLITSSGEVGWSWTCVLEQVGQ